MEIFFWSKDASFTVNMKIIGKVVKVEKKRVHLREETREYFKKEGLGISEEAIELTIDKAQEFSAFLNRLPPDVAEALMCDVERKVAEGEKAKSVEELKRIIQGK